MTLEGLRRLKVWVKAQDFALKIYSQVLPLLPPEEKWNLNSQLRRSFLSISANTSVREDQAPYFTESFEDSTTKDTVL